MTSLSLSLMVVLTLFAARLDAQSWAPVHIMGMPYVAEAREARIAGVVRLKCTLNADGWVADIEVLSGHRVFLGAVLENARRWRFATGDSRSASARIALL